jgi:PAS domain S-box-containing protein
MKIKFLMYLTFLAGWLAVLPNCLRAGNLPIKLYTSADGLGSSFVNSMTRDSRGFMWFATRDGLSRFDGSEFTTYKIGKNGDAPGVEQIYEAENGIYWITTTGGTFHFDSNAAGKANTSREPEKNVLDAQLATSARSAIYKDKKGNLWMGGAAPMQVRESNGEFSFEEIAVSYPDDEWRKYQILNFFETADESLWMVTSYGLIRRMAGGGTAFYHFGENDKVDLKYALADTAGRIWVDFNNSVEVFMPEPASEMAAGSKVTTRNFLVARAQGPAPNNFSLPSAGGQISHFASAGTGENFNQIYESSDGRIWIAARNSVIEFDGKKRRRYDAAHGIPAHVAFVCEDAAGNLWFGGQGGAARLNRFGLESFSAADNLKSEEIQALYERGGVLYAVNGGYISRFDGTKFETARPRIDENATFSWLSSVAFPDSRGDWWILTQNKLYRFAAQREFQDIASQKPSAIYTVANGLKGNTLFRAFEDSRGDLWISSRGQDSQSTGLTHWSRGDGKFYAFGEKDNFPTGKSPVSFAEDAEGTLWFGFYEDGLIRYKNGVFSEVKEKLPKGFYSQILFDRQKRLWLASAQSGVTRFDNPQDLTNISARFTSENGLASNNARSLAEAANGDVYVGTARGVDRIANGSGEIRHYSIADGLKGDLVGTMLAEAAGDLWFGTTNGLSRLSPGNERKNPAPQAWIGSLRVTGENRFVPPLGTKEISNLELAANQNNLQIDFFAVNFAGGDLRYQYKLENTEADWSEPAATRTINFANLVSGDYRFAVRAINSDGAANETPATVSFTIAPPVYRRWWFLSVAGLVLASAIFGLDRFRVKKTKEVETALKISRESAERFRTLAQTASDAIITVNKDSRIVFVNDAVKKIFGYTENELIGADLTVLMPDAFRQAHYAGMERYVETNEKHISWAAIELPGKHKSGREIPLELSFGEFTSDGKRYFTGIARDVSERKKAEETLRDAFGDLSVSENRFRQMNEQSPLGTVIFAPDGSIRSVNKAYEDFWGITFEQIKHWDFLSDEQIIKSGVADKLRPVFSGGTMSLPPIPYDPQTNSAGVKVAEKAEVRWIQSFAYPVKSDAGELLEVIMVMEDVTDSKRADELEQKAKTDRLRELEQVRRRIAADLHDDIGSSLTQISIFSEVLQQRIDKTNERVLEPLEFIAGSSRELVEAMSDIVWAINPQKDFLGELSGKMRRFAADIFTARDIQFTFDAAGLDDKLALGANLRREIFLIFKESVNNIVKHAGCKSVEIRLTVNNSEIRLSLHDDGAGFDVNKISDGHGLISMKQRAAGLGGRLEIVSDKTAGTTTTLIAPLTPNADEKV